MSKYQKKLTDYYNTLTIEEIKPLLQEWYTDKTGDETDIENPKTFNQKLQWLKLYDSTPLKTKLADKYLMRDWITDKVGGEYLVPILGAWERFEDIDFERLPDQFVLKANHGSGYNIIVRDKKSLDKVKAKKKFDSWMRENFAYKCGFEMHYRDINPMIIAEKYIADMDGDITDYKFFCFNGEPYCIWVDIGSGTPQHQRSIFNLDWVEEDYTVHWPKLSKKPNKPRELPRMIELARVLSKGFAFVRVDLYSISSQVYVGEMTFTSQSGYGKFSDSNVALQYGNLLTLPPKYILPPKINHT